MASRSCTRPRRSSRFDTTSRQRPSARARSNLRPTLRMMAGYGLIGMQPGEGRRLKPKVVPDRVSLDLPLVEQAEKKPRESARQRPEIRREVARDCSVSCSERFRGAQRHVLAHGPLASTTGAGTAFALMFQSGGSGGIRTHDTVARMPVFKTGAFNHSATLPCRPGALRPVPGLPPSSRHPLPLAGMPATLCQQPPVATSGRGRRPIPHKPSGAAPSALRLLRPTTRDYTGRRGFGSGMRPFRSPPAARGREAGDGGRSGRDGRPIGPR